MDMGWFDRLLHHPVAYLLGNDVECFFTARIIGGVRIYRKRCSIRTTGMKVNIFRV